MKSGAYLRYMYMADIARLVINMADRLYAFGQSCNLI